MVKSDTLHQEKRDHVWDESNDDIEMSSMTNRQGDTRKWQGWQ